MRVLVTGSEGRVASGIKQHLGEDHEFVYLDREDAPDVDYVADIADYEAIRPAFDGVDAVVHLAANPTTEASWESVQQSNLAGTRNVLEAASDAEVERFIFASSIHAAGMWEEEGKPDVYELDDDTNVTVDDDERPDSYYGVSKAYGEDMGRFYIETREYPKRFYAARIASVRGGLYDNPYGDAEKGVEEGEWERGSEKYTEQVKRLKGTWLSLRDWAQLVELCLTDEETEFGIFFATSDNPRSWFDLEHTKELLGYEPEDSASDWQSPPQELLE
ncbi:NAD-dependent epimerase/dehydratase family protein [Halolamina salifodinae]|uniref:Nucleoside-diphosphate-sugar epimerase n=1 Tax=Halolamina salifodinae TaxID=1202767 RepID=A0A8T4GZH5_9EURY|nr:NAD(P)-dependent oxidoreductase [Halolamina salifodinae]MBP1988376.1 nucleoside-diphosphate-sugar epimerase [Halolamina salifodinae]